MNHYANAILTTVRQTLLFGLVLMLVVGAAIAAETARR